jgi:tetratricopeptide (TPR) repeat protein
MSLCESSQKVIWAHYLVMFVACCAAFGNLAGYEFVWDDIFFYVNNNNLSSATFYDFFTNDMWHFTSLRDSTESVIYRPILSLFIYINVFFFGENTFSHHLFNIFLHFLCVCFVYNFLFTFDFKANYNVNFVGALFFALHPIHVEPIVFVGSFSHILVTLFLLSSFLLHCPEIHRKNNLRLVLSLILYALALLTLEIALAFPFVIILYEWLKFRKLLSFKQIALIVISFIYLYVRSVVLGKALPLSIKSTGVFLDLLGLLSGYIKSLFFPWPQGIYFDAPEFGFLDYTVTAVVISCLALLVYQFRRDKGRRFAVIFSSGWIVLFIMPALAGTLSGKALFSPRALYLPSVGLTLLVTAWLSQLERPKWRAVLITCVAILFFVSVLNYTRAWKDNLTLHSRAYEISPESGTASLHYGAILFREGNYSEAEGVLLSAVSKVGGDNIKSGAHEKLGTLYGITKKYELSRNHYLKSLSYSFENSDSLLGLGNLAWMEGDLSQAENYYLRSLAADAYNFETCVNLAQIYKIQGDVSRATRYSNLAEEIEKNR